MSGQNNEVRKKANRYFFTKVVINVLLIIIGAVLIALFLRQMQHRTALVKQAENSKEALAEAVETLNKNAQDAEELTKIFHDGNQDMLKDLEELFNSGLMDFLISADSETRSKVFADIVERAGLEFLLIVGPDNRIIISPDPRYNGVDLVRSGIVTEECAERLKKGTELPDGTVAPALVMRSYKYAYFYSIPSDFRGSPYVTLLGTSAAVLDVQIGSLKDVGTVLQRASVGSDGFMFAVDRGDGSFIYYKTETEDLTGQDAREAGLSEAALSDGYAGQEIINGTKYYCVSRSFGDSTVICAVAETGKIFINDKYVLFWSILGFVLVMIMCLVYAIIVRNDFIRHAVETKKKFFGGKKGSPWILDISIFKRTFPLMVIGVLIVFFISFYTQTLLEISEAIEDSEIALSEVSARYEDSLESRRIITDYYDNRYLAKAKLLSFLMEADPSAMNENTDKIHSYYDENNRKHYLTDDEGNDLRSVSNSARLQALCDENDIESIYIFNTDGNTIATNTDKWYFSISHNKEDQSYPFLEILDGKKDILIQEAMTSDVGVTGQYIGVTFNYYTSRAEDGSTKYMSQYDYQDGAGSITRHSSMLQIGLDQEVSKRLLASTEIGYIMSANTLNGGFMVLFDNSEDHLCVYSPREASIGVKASELGVSSKAFTGADYFGFMRINGTRYFTFFRYADGYFIATAIPKASMYTARATIAAITALVSLLLILFLTGTVTLTSKEEEQLYATMSDDQAKKGLDSAIFNIILPSGNRATTVKAAARWDNKRIPWSEKSPEQKLMLICSVLGCILIAYLILTVVGANYLFKDDSIVKYILSGDWDRGPNIFAYSACFLVLIGVALIVALFRIPVRIVTALVGTRGETIGHLLLSVVKYGGAIGGLFYCLYLLGIDASSLLASAGILSLVIGLGAQSLIKDILAGIFIVFEGEFRVGDIVTIGGYRGTVMDIGLRTTKILGMDGNIKIYNNSEISGVLNMTKEASIAKTFISIEYGQDIEYVEAVLKRDLPALGKKNSKIISGPRYRGVHELGDSGVSLLITCECNEADIKSVLRYMNRGVLQIFYRNGITVPFPNVTISNIDPNHKPTIEDFKEEPSGGPENK